ncbi:MAG: F0F1 ATP synthase subunit gamma [Acidobacteria bacterium Pan2503]|uniref:ATP synthase gamma chain n=1 Tax=Candidatus Acidiferrum panamense TaxID=2741543 RepID=A0A7V8NSG7_9BACT|nr:F0F1 ATP synthase subunit gamma [Candidatus Acidoferrum panamensis]
MANLLDIRRRIRSVSNTRQITRAMKLVAAARLRRAQDRALSARPYEQMLASVLKSLVSRAEIYDPKSGEARHPLLAHREEKNILLILVTGDRGLAGAFNSNIVRAAIRFVNEKAGLDLRFSESLQQDGGAARMHGPLQRIEVHSIGRKGRDFFRRRFPVAEPNSRGRGIYLVADRLTPMSKVDLSQATELAARIIDRYTRGEVDSVYLAFNEFKSVIAQRVVVDKLLPVREIGRANVQQAEGLTEDQQRRALKAAQGTGTRLRAADTLAIDEHSARFAAAKVDYIYEQSPDEIFNSLLPNYVGVQMFRALLESVAAEHSARMTAMDSATNNANEMNDSLTLAMDRARQAKITKEIIEIVSGAAGQ